jgi:hypothetical protein
VNFPRKYVYDWNIHAVEDSIYLESFFLDFMRLIGVVNNTNIYM